MTKIRHVGITVSNLEKSLKFYCGILGFIEQKVMLEKGEFIDGLSGLNGVIVKTAKLRDCHNNEVLLELLEYKSPKSTPFWQPKKPITCPGISHFALTVDNIDHLYQSLKSEIEFNAPPAVSPDGGAKVAFCRDPENNLIELVQELK
jgi:glyoxylase I family protein